MRMTHHTDYALRMLIALAVSDEDTTTVADIAGRYRISRNHLLKVALHLKQLKLIETTRGRSGGVRLGRDPADINIGALVRTMEGDFALVECLKSDGGQCAIEPVCRLKGVVREALEAYLKVFDRYTLADLVKNGDALKQMLGLSSLPRASARSRVPSLGAE